MGLFMLEECSNLLIKTSEEELKLFSKFYINSKAICKELITKKALFSKCLFCY